MYIVECVRLASLGRPRGAHSGELLTRARPRGALSARANQNDHSPSRVDVHAPLASPE